MTLVRALLTAEAVGTVQMMAVDLRLLRSFAMEEADKLQEQYPEAINLLEKTEWYDVMFLCDERIAVLKKASGRYKPNVQVFSEIAGHSVLLRATGYRHVAGTNVKSRPEPVSGGRPP
ncbi:hypothetical protein MAR_017429 [Mya arenaria]|uniref:Uncharacterized protein n=1 Tax=Mya arenaria TaxID=6604 RepID=A0ABY7EFA0_MYAAR|nr:hypothetical protein MAR_017429 [Mya arenaria]